MARHKFSATEAIRFGWKTTKANFWFFVGILAVAVLFTALPDYFAETNRKQFPILANIIGIVGFAIEVWIGIGLLKIAINLNQQKPVVFSDLFSGHPFFFNYLIAAIVYGLIIFVGCILLVVPGIVWAIKFYFFGYFIIDQGCGPIEALKRSWHMTTGIKWDLFVFMLLLLLINLAGALALLVGLFATVPTAMLACAFVYRKLSSQQIL